MLSLNEHIPICPPTLYKPPFAENYYILYLPFFSHSPSKMLGLHVFHCSFFISAHYKRARFSNYLERFFYQGHRSTGAWELLCTQLCTTFLYLQGEEHLVENRRTRLKFCLSEDVVRTSVLILATFLIQPCTWLSTRSSGAPVASHAKGHSRFTR